MGNKLTEVIVIGSINTDLVADVERLPFRGETIHALGYEKHLGGKGANQAAAAQKLGTKTLMVGSVGNDKDGLSAIRGLEALGVDCAFVQKVQYAPTGTALITVDQKGDNTIVVVPGANADLKPAHLSKIQAVLATSKAVVMQLEVEEDVVFQTADMVAELRAKKKFPWFVFNPSPFKASAIPASGTIDLLLVNEVESQQMSGVEVACPRSAAIAAEQLLKELRSGGCVVVTLGVQGAVALASAGGPFCLGGQQDLLLHIPAHEVEPVDTTGAGDVFTGGLIAQLTSGHSLPSALRYATAAAALTVMKPGAQASFPNHAAVAEILPLVPKARVLTT